MIKFFISVTSHPLDPPLSQTVTPSPTPTPSSVAYFMDGPRIGLRIPQNAIEEVHYGSRF